MGRPNRRGAVMPQRRSRGSLRGGRPAYCDPMIHRLRRGPQFRKRIIGGPPAHRGGGIKDGHRDLVSRGAQVVGHVSLDI